MLTAECTQQSTVPRLTVRFATDMASLGVLQESWTALEKTPVDRGANFFQSFAWCRLVAGIRLSRSSSRFRLAVATVHAGNEIVGIWPLSLQKQSGLWTLRNLDDPFGQFAGVLAARSEWVDACVLAVIRQVRENNLADAICIANVVEGSALSEVMLSLGGETASTNEIVQVDMRSAATFGEYHKTLNAKTRKNLRNAMNRLSGQGEVRNDVIDRGERLPAVIKRAFDNRLEWMRRRGKSTGAFRDPAFRTIVEALPSTAGLSLLGFELHSNDNVIASQWGFVHQNRYYAYISARDEGHDQFSPGRLHLGNVLEACKVRGIDIVELMAPASRYKTMWSRDVERIHDMVLALTVRGRLTLGVLEYVMPVAMSIARALPSGLKKNLAGKVNAN